MWLIMCDEMDPMSHVELIRVEMALHVSEMIIDENFDYIEFIE